MKDTIVTFSLVFFLISLISLVNYFFSKKIAKLSMNVQRIDKRRDLAKSEKLSEVVRIIKNIAIDYRIPEPEIGVYPSNEINAFATGRTNDSLIAFSSRILRKMSVRELRGVIGHELSHIIHKDVALILLIQGFFDFFHTVICYFFRKYLSLVRNDRNDEEERKKRDDRYIVIDIILIKIFGGILHFLGKIIICNYNRKRELKADLSSAKMLGFDNMIISLEKLLFLENKR